MPQRQSMGIQEPIEYDRKLTCKQIIQRRAKGVHENFYQGTEKSPRME